MQVCVHKMAAVTVSAELKFRDGQREKICVQVENNLKSLVHGIQDLNTNISRLLSELVEREKLRGSCGEDEDKGDSDEDDETEDPLNPEQQPPAKRSRS